MQNCNLCPNGCNVNRKIQKGICGTDEKLRIAKFYLHKFEEPIISGKNGSGTVFFCGCSLRCAFCQNYELSRNLRGKTITEHELADIFKKLEDTGAHNINLVTPTHYSDKIIKALDIYRPKIPIVYNTHAYENVEVLKILNDYVDVYLPDLKYFAPEISYRYTDKKNYFEIASKAIKFMIDSKPIKIENNMLKSGVLLRHLVLPQNIEDSKNLIKWFSQFKDRAYLSLMSQYTPFGEIDNFPELKRKITPREYNAVIDYALSLEIDNMFYQKRQSANEIYIPTWDF